MVLLVVVYICLIWRLNALILLALVGSGKEFHINVVLLFGLYGPI